MVFQWFFRFGGFYVRLRSALFSLRFLHRFLVDFGVDFGVILGGFGGSKSVILGIDFWMIFGLKFQEPICMCMWAVCMHVWHRVCACVAPCACMCGRVCVPKASQDPPRAPQDHPKRPKIDPRQPENDQKSIQEANNNIKRKHTYQNVSDNE